MRNGIDESSYPASYFGCTSLLKNQNLLKSKESHDHLNLTYKNVLPQRMKGASLKCSMWNVTSMVHKTEDIMEYILDRDYDVVFLSETWLTSDFNHVTALVKSYGYMLLHNRRKNRLKEIGGGVGILLKLSIGSKHIKSKEYSSFELTIVKVFLTNEKSLTLVCIYRLLFMSITVFFEELVQMLENLITSKDIIILAGDVNIHTETTDVHSRQFSEVLDMFNMVQHVKCPTHKLGHTLDIVATLRDNPPVINVRANE